MDKYKLPIQYKHYTLLNKDQFIDSFFGVKDIGYCQKVFSDYAQDNENITKIEWERYYDKKVGFRKLARVFEKIKKRCQSYGLLESEIKWYIFYRAIGQTWNGLVTEQEVIDLLRPHFPYHDFKKTTYQIDHDYCIDWEMVIKDKKVLGLQIKPISYLYMNTPYQLLAKENHRALNEKYKEKYCPYVYVYYDKNTIHELEKLIQEIHIKKI